jgi:chitodextrinase
VFSPKDNLNTETGPEGLEFIPASQSPTGTPILLIANEVSGNVSMMQINLSDSNPDTIQPSQPGKPMIRDAIGNQLQIRWTAATDNFRVEGYRVFVNGVHRMTVKDDNTTIRNLVPATEYQITVQAIDRSKNTSLMSAPLVFATKPMSSMIIDTVAPAAPLHLKASDVGVQGFRVSWDHSVDQIGIKEYEVYRNGRKMVTVKHNSYRFTGITPGSNNQIRVLAVDFDNNKSILSDTLQVTTSNMNVSMDTIAPQTPNNLAVSQQTADGFRVQWTASTDNVLTLGYNVYLDGKYVASVASPNYVFTNLSTNKTYQVAILAYDWNKNRSVKSTPISVTLSN